MNPCHVKTGARVMRMWRREIFLLTECTYGTHGEGEMSEGPGLAGGGENADTSSEQAGYQPIAD